MAKTVSRHLFWVMIGLIFASAFFTWDYVTNAKDPSPWGVYLFVVAGTAACWASVRVVFELITELAWQYVDVRVHTFPITLDRVKRNSWANIGMTLLGVIVFLCVVLNSVE